jgi:hypothetical protein
MRKVRTPLSVIVAVGVVAVSAAFGPRYYHIWQLNRVPAGSPQYATAQRLLGWNYYAGEGNLREAKLHVDHALAASPHDPKVLEDAGRVYVLCGLRSQGEAMLIQANTPVAQAFLASRHGT